MPRVSVVMPVYNAGSALRQAVASVLAQTLTDFELIIIDDCSTDGCTRFLDMLDDDRVRSVRNETNLGAPASRNRALELARGEFVAIADADDMMLPLRLEVQLGRLDDETDLDLVAGAAQVFGEVEQLPPPSIPVTTNAALMLGLRYGPSFFHGSIMVRRSAMESVGGYSKLALTEDYDLYSRLLLAGCSFGAVTDVVLLYRHHGEGISKTRAAEARQIHADISELLQRRVQIPAMVELVRSARSEPCARGAEPRVRYLKLLGRTAREHVPHQPAIVFRCALAALACGPSTWFALGSDIVQRRLHGRARAAFARVRPRCRCRGRPWHCPRGDL